MGEARNKAFCTVGQRTASTYTFGAICAKDGKGAGLFLPRCTTVAMSLGLAEIATQVAPGTHAALFPDQAAWHLSGRLVVVAEVITLVPLPPKCPELNPVERLGVHARKLAVEPRIQILRRNPRPLLLRLEQVGRSTLEDHAHRKTRLGLSVLISEN